MRRSVFILLLVTVLSFAVATTSAFADKPIATIPPGTWHGSSTWSVVAFDAAGAPLAVSAVRPVSP